uniref:Large ribosomal subunit protein uL23c n=2 Tax=unclassified Ostreobium TaxID=2086555 RepID=A0A1X9RQ77_9CHLO|nr:ribosomal protein L23 [Ostreobium sp. HV05042]ARQ82321.1 ribosomal protein L23 [Ostreobium sp. HV05007a]
MNLFLKYPVLTEKSAKLIEKNQYTFFIDSKLTKKQAKLIIEKLYSIKIISLQSNILPKKRKRFNKFEGYKKKYKKIIVRIKPEQSLQILPNN